MMHCAQQTLQQEIEYANPRIIVAFGEYAYKFLFNKEAPFGMAVENGKLYKGVEIFGEKRDVFCSLHPSWHVRQSDACGIGVLYEVVRRAVDYAVNGVDLLIPNKFNTKLLTDYEDVKHVLLKMRHSPNIIAVDTEDANLNRVYGNDILSVQLSNNGKTGYVIPIDHFDSPFKGDEKIKKLFHNFFTKTNNKSTGYVFVNAKYDMHQLFSKFNVIEYNAPILDCSFAEYSLDENWTRLHGFPQGKGHFSLFTMAYKRGFSYYAESEMKETRAYLSHLPLNKWAQYGGADVVAPWHIFKSQQLQAERTDYLENFIKLNYVFFSHLIRSCLYVEHCGLSIDTKVLNYLYGDKGPFEEAYKEVMDEFYKCKSVQKLNDKLIKESIGHTSNGLFGVSRLFKPSRFLHIERLYFEELGLSKVEDDDDEEASGTLGKAFQQQYKDSYPEVALLEQFNTLNKMKTGFVNPVYKWMSPKSKDKKEDFYLDERVRANFTYMAVTGRLRAYDPNCQRIWSKIVIDGQEISFAELMERDGLKNGDDVNYNILTPTGYRKAYKFWFYKKQPVLRITTENDLIMECTYRNDCLRYNYETDTVEKLKAEELSVGDYFICNDIVKDGEFYCGSKTRFGLAVRIVDIKDIGLHDVADFTVERDYSQESPLYYGSIVVNGLWSFQSQQRPSRGKHTKTILSMYSPKKGRAVVKLDYVTFEVKGLGFISKDPAMIKSFNEMHKLKDEFRENPYVFYEQGKEVEKNALLKKHVELKERKAKLPALKEVSKDDYLEAKKKLSEDIAEFKKEKEKFKATCKENPVKFSLDYLKFQTDFHRRSASLFNKCSVEEVSKSARQNAKSLVFGSIYGRGIDSIAKELKIEKSVAQQYFDAFMANMPEAGAWLQEMPRYGKEHLYVESPLGRRRRVWGYLFDNKTIHGKMDRFCQNCIDGNTLIATEQGLVPIKNLVGKKFKCVVNGELRKNDGCVSRGIRETVKMETERGYSLIGTPDHKVQVFTKDLTYKMKALEDLTSEDYICIERQNNIWPDEYTFKKNDFIEKMTHEFARLLGYLISEGSIFETKSYINFSNKNKYVFDDFLNCWNSTFPDYSPIFYQRKDGVWIFQKCSKDIVAFLKKIGFHRKQDTRGIPNCIMQSNKECASNFISALYEGDGHNRIKHVGYTSISKKLIQKLRILLQRFGISSNLYIEEAHEEKVVDRICWVQTAYQIHCVGKDYTKFNEIIGFVSPTKRGRYVERKSELWSRITDYIPYLKEYNKDLRGMLSFKSSRYKGRRIWLGSPKFTERRRLREEKYIDTIEWMKGKKEADKFRRIKKDDYIYDRVKSVTKVKDREVFDIINVEGGNKFVANGMVIANSTIQGICSDCNLIATSLLITLMHHHNKLWYQCNAEDCWVCTNLVHDSCEMELPITDVYYALKTFESLYTNLLMHYIKKAFDFEIQVPLEVDFTVGSNYANTEDWDGSDEHARKLQKWVLEECGKRDGCNYSHLYDYAINHPYFKKYKGMAKRVVDEWIAVSENTYSNFRLKRN